MATNDILPFSPTDTGSNLLTQGEYLIAPDRTIGNEPGIASLKLVNKAIRQSAFITSQLAQYISDKLNSNVLDDANTATLLALINSAFAPNDEQAVENLTIAAAVGASALTVSVKTLAGTNASATDIIYVGMRSATLTSGLYTRRTITGSLSMVVSSGSTLGQTSAQPSYIWVYLIDNAGTLELAVSHTKYTEDALVTTTAEGGAGAADSATAIYSSTARSNVPIRLIGYILNTQATAGTWASTATQIQLLPAQRKVGPTVTAITAAGSGTYNTPAGCTAIRVRMMGGGGGGGGSGAASSGGAGGTGITSTFGTTLLSCTGGAGGGGGATGSPGGLGGGASLGTGPVGVALTGGAGGSGPADSNNIAGGMGASGPFGGAGVGPAANVGTTGGTAQANTGAGGGGAGGSSTTKGGGGGGASGYVEALITNPLSSYAYVVGAGGTAGTAGTSGALGGVGGTGVIIVEEYYQ